MTWITINNQITINSKAGEQQYNYIKKQLLKKEYKKAEIIYKGEDKKIINLLIEIKEYFEGVEK